MAVERKDAVKDQTTTTGTGTVVIGLSAPAGSRTMAAHTSGATVRYRIQQADNSEWEVGEGVWTSGANTLTRVTVFASSNANALVNFSVGTKIVWTGPVAKDTEAVSVGTTAPTTVVDGLGFYKSDELRKLISYGAAMVEEARGVTGAAFDMDGGDSTTVNWTQNNVFDFGASA